MTIEYDDLIEALTLLGNAHMGNMDERCVWSPKMPPGFTQDYLRAWNWVREAVFEHRRKNQPGSEPVAAVNDYAAIAKALKAIAPEPNVVAVEKAPEPNVVFTGEPIKYLADVYPKASEITHITGQIGMLATIEGNLPADVQCNSQTEMILRVAEERMNKYASTAEFWNHVWIDARAQEARQCLAKDASAREEQSRKDWAKAVRDATVVSTMRCPGYTAAKGTKP